MVILLPSSSTILASKARVSSSHPTSLPASLSCFLSLRSTLRRPPPLVLVNSSKTRRAVAELVDDNEESSAVSSSSSELGNSRTFLDARSVEGISALSYALYVSAYLLSVIQREKEAGRLPLNVAQGMEELYHNYRDAVFQRGDPKACEIFLSNMAVALDRIFMVVKEPFVFSPYHKAIREPFDYYKFGQKYIRPLIDFRSSYVGNISLFNDIEEKLRQKICRNFTEGRFISVELVFLYHKIKGDSVVLIANHQTEADPAVIALLLESTNPDIAEGMTYIAGDRVVTDPLCKPFSMGRNLLCVYSKKHMGDDPELIEMKKRSNIRSLKEMAMLLSYTYLNPRCGSKIIWIAPSGGRDRPDPVTKEWLPAPFDASSVDNMRRLVEHAGVPGHIYPLALLCHDIMRPPAQVEKEIGERRVIGFHGTGLSVAPPINFHEIAAACEDPEEVKEAYTQVLYDSIHQQYGVLKSAIHGKQGLEASIPPVSLSQPWN